MEEKEKAKGLNLSFEEWKDVVKNTGKFGSIIALLLIYGPENLGGFLGRLLKLGSSVVTDGAKNIFAWILRNGSGPAVALNRKLRQVTQILFLLNRIGLLLVPAYFAAITASVYHHTQWGLIITGFCCGLFALLHAYVVYTTARIINGAFKLVGRTLISPLGELSKGLSKAGLKKLKIELEAVEKEIDERLPVKRTVVQKFRDMYAFACGIFIFPVIIAFSPSWPWYLCCWICVVVFLACVCIILWQEWSGKIYVKIFLGFLLVTMIAVFFGGLINTVDNKLLPNIHKSIKSSTTSWFEEEKPVKQSKISKLQPSVPEPAVNNEPDYEDGDEESHINPNELVRDTVGNNIPPVVPRRNTGLRDSSSRRNSGVGDEFWYEVAEIIREVDGE
ncbi:hypothetical protein ACFL29_01770 [Patescibacteria group bacterium]